MMAQSKPGGVCGKLDSKRMMEKQGLTSTDQHHGNASCVASAATFAGTPNGVTYTSAGSLTPAIREAQHLTQY